MGKRLRSTVQSSAEELLYSAASKISTKAGKAEVKSFIWSIGPSSCLVSSLPAALHLAILNALESFKLSLQSGSSVDVAAVGDIKCSTPPALKKIRRSARLKRSDGLGWAATPPRSCSQILDIQKKLRAFACIAHFCASHPKKLFSPSDLLPPVQFLHDNLVLYDDPSLLSEVASLCEWWWKDNLPERESLISQSLPFLLSKSLTHCKKTDVRRIYVFREAFTLFDYEDESTEDLRLLLVRCVINPLYLKTKDGRSFIAFMVGLSGLLLKEVLELIKSQIPFGKKSVLEGYADIIFKAWRGSEDSVKVEIEDGFLQGLIEGAIHANTKQFAASIRKVINGFVGQRTTPGVEKVLFRLAEPVLFRSLQVANSNVRQNALFLLLDLFPLEDPDATKEVKDTLLERQFFLLQKLLTDDCPEVRGVAVEGLCRILNLFWEVIPSLSIAKILRKVIDDMTRDICNEVRLSTLNGIIYLLENPQSHEIMKVLLPKLSFVLSDPALSVRIAATDLLLVVGHIRSFQFNKIVSLDSLFSSLAHDHERVARKITRLLIPSYFPPNLDPKEACNRFSALLRRSLDAAARFCEFALSEGSSSKSLMKLLRFSLGLILVENDLSSDQLDGLIIASANICSCLATELSNKTLIELLSTDKIKSLFNAATSSRAQIAVLTIASIVSSNNLHGLQEQCLILALECIGLSDDLERHGLIRKIHRLLFSFGLLSDLIGKLSSILQNIASRFLVKLELDVPSQVLQSIKKKIKLPAKSSTRICVPKEYIKPDKFKIERDLSLAAGIAWQLKDLVADVDMRKVSIESCVRCESFDTSPIEALATLAVYLNLENDGSVLNEVLDNDAENRSWCMNSPFKGTILSNTLDKLLHYAEKIFNKSVYKEFTTPTSKIKLSTKKTQLTRSRHERAAASASNRIDELVAKVYGLNNQVKNGFILD